MADQTYGISEIVGTSPDSLENAIRGPFIVAAIIIGLILAWRMALEFRQISIYERELASPDPEDLTLQPAHEVP